jgi:hypothetical protein
MPRAYHPWKTSEERALREALEAGLTMRQAAALLGRKLDSVRHKAMTLGIKADRSLEARIRRQCTIDATDPDACWVWAGHVAKSDGKPRINIGGRPVSVLPAAMRKAGLWKSHYRIARTTCGDRMCVRPDHGKGYTYSEYVRGLFKEGALGTASHNAARTAERRTRAKLNLELVVDLRRRHAAGESISALMSLAPGVHRDSVVRAIRGDTWREVKGSGSVFAWRPEQRRAA